MPTTAEVVANYEAQGYKLPEGVTVEMVAEHQARYDIDLIFVPLVALGFVTAWGVPFVDGKPLQHA